MLSVFEAQERILATVRPQPTERVPLDQALGRVSAMAVHAPVALPPWNNSAMDGYAVRWTDTIGACPERPVALRLTEVIAAGGVGELPVGPGQAAMIMTGAPMPEGADAVVAIEDSDGARTGMVQLTQAVSDGRHVRRRGEAVAEGDAVIGAGTAIHPGVIALLASLGIPEVAVARRPVVGLVCTGDELVEPGGTLGPGQIFASNGLALSAQLRAAGAIPRDYGVVRDDPEQQRQVFAEACAACDLVLSTGGVSVGLFDHVKGVLADLGVDVDFWKVKMKPGKPLAFGTLSGKAVFGLPGNPVSCMVAFDQFVRPWIRRSLGDMRPFLAVVDAVAGADFDDRATRMRFLRARLRVRDDGRWEATGIGMQSSGAVVELAHAHGLVLVPEGAAPPRAGDAVRVQLLDPSFLDGEGPGWSSP